MKGNKYVILLYMSSVVVFCCFPKCIFLAQSSYVYSEDDYKGHECGGPQLARGVAWEYLVDATRLAIMTHAAVHAGTSWFAYQRPKAIVTTDCINLAMAVDCKTCLLAIRKLLMLDQRYCYHMAVGKFASQQCILTYQYFDDNSGEDVCVSETYRWRPPNF